MSSPKSPDGLYSLNPWSPFTLRASAAGSSTTVVGETAVTAFGGCRDLLVVAAITALSFTGGSAPTAQLQAWLQRTPDDGTTWDDVLALQSAALAAAAALPVLLIGEVVRGLGSAVTPAATQAAGGTPPFAQRSGLLTDKLRVAWKLVLTGSPTAVSMTFAVTAQGRP